MINACFLEPLLCRHIVKLTADAVFTLASVLGAVFWIAFIMAFYVKMSSAPGECAREAIRQGVGVSAAVCMGYAVADNWSGQ